MPTHQTMSGITGYGDLEGLLYLQSPRGIGTCHKLIDVPVFARLEQITIQYTAREV